MSGVRAPALTLQLYTEDARDGKRACATLEAVVRGLLTLLEPGLDLDRIAFRPLPEAPARRVSGSSWKTKKNAEVAAHNKRRNLIQDIATALRRGHIVAFHVDGDDCYLRDGSHAEVWTHFAHLQRDVAQLTPRGILLQHVFLPVVPFYSLESWAYANETLLLEVLTKPRDLEFLAQWMDAPGTREDIRCIKDDTLSIKDELNEKLVRVDRGFPREDLVKLGKSYADTHRRFADSPKLRIGLAAAVARPDATPAS